jgi:type I restriction enzyme R subunit
MVLGGESGAVQRPFIRYAVEAGWTYLSPDEALCLRSGITSPVLDTVLAEQLQELNPAVIDAGRAQDVVKQLLRVRLSIEGNLDAWEYLKGLKTIFVAEEKRECNVKLLDSASIEANVFHVTEEFPFSNGVPPDIRPDIVFFVNGVPVIIVETKRATAAEGIAEAMDDIRYYHRKGPELLVLTQVHAVTHLIRFHYGATWSLSNKDLFDWRDDTIEPTDFEALCKSFVAPRRILRLLTEFILFTRKDEELSKAVLRPHQMRAVERCLGRARDRKKRRGLIWHTQGSGKTYTMITVAKRLIEDPSFDNPTVLMLVDRNELEAQLSGNLEAVGFRSVEVARTKAHLRKVLAGDRRGLIVSMIHKFDGIPADLNPGRNIFVLMDEAHRSTSGDLGNYLMGALPNATFIGFTGTPIDRTAHGKGTFKIFGIDDEQGYLDKYSIRESINDGTTVPLHYSLAPNELRVDRETLEREFLDLADAKGVSDFDELNRVLERAVTLKNMLKNRDRVEKVAAFVAEHFGGNVEPMGYKAFLVGVDREACCLYKKALDQHLPADYSTVVISQAGKKDSEILKQHYLPEDREKAVRKDFRRPDKLPKILIVTEKLLTGFDAPILYCMYLDKPMRDHVLLQAIARVNRPYEDEDGRRKPSGFVLDFVGIFEKLEKALAFDSKDVSGVIEGLDVLRQRFSELMEDARRDHLLVIKGKFGDKQVEAVLEHFRDKERRQEFYGFFHELQDLYEILSPDAFLRPFLREFGDLLGMFHILRNFYERGKPADREFLRKTARLVQEHTKSGRIQEPEKFYALNAETLAKIAGRKQPDTVRVFNLLRVLHDLVSHRAAAEPYLISIGDRAEEIAQAFEQHQMDAQQALQSLEALIRELREAESAREATGLSPEGFAAYFLFKQEGIAEPRRVAEQVAGAFGKYPHWQTSERQEQEVRVQLYKALIQSGTEKALDGASKLMKLLRRSQRG